MAGSTDDLAFVRRLAEKLPNLELDGHGGTFPARGDELQAMLRRVADELVHARRLLGMATTFHLGPLLGSAPHPWKDEFHCGLGISITAIPHPEGKRWIMGSRPYWMTVDGRWPGVPRKDPSLQADEYVFDSPQAAFAVLEAWRQRLLDEIARHAAE